MKSNIGWRNVVLTQDEERRIASVIGRKEDEKKRETSKMAALTVNMPSRLLRERLRFLLFICCFVRMSVWVMLLGKYFHKILRTRKFETHLFFHV